MAIDTNVQTFTDTELLNLTRKAIADVLTGGQAYGVNGRQFTRADLPELRAMAADLEERIAATAAGEAGGGNVLVQFGQPQDP